MADQTFDPSKPFTLAVAPTEAHPEAKMSAAAPGTAFPGDTGDVTFEDLRANPAEAIGRIGTMLKRDLSDPSVWMQAASMYFGPKVFSRAAPIVMRAAANATRGIGEVATPGMAKDLATVGLGEGRVNAGLRIAGRVAEATRAVRGVQEPAPPPAAAPVAAPEPVAPAAVAPPETAVPAPPAATFKPGVSGKFTAAEVAQGMKWKAAGVSDAQILERIEASRAFNAAAGLTPPTVAQTKFPKGMRGGAPR